MKAIKSLFFVYLFNFICGEELFGWQSSWNEGGFGAAVLYDKETKSLFITGTESVTDSKSKCFLVNVNKMTGKSLWQNDYTQHHSSQSDLASCSSLTKWKAMDVVASGFTEEDNSQAVQVKGFLFSAPQETGLVNHNAYFTDYQVQYPQIIEEDGDNNAIIVASYVTNNPTLSLAYKTFEKVLDPLLQPTSDVLKYGSSFSFTLRQFKVTSNGDIGWTREFKTSGGEDSRIHDFIVYKSRIIFVGATAGSGSDLGGTNTGSDMDGFVTQLSSATGNTLDTKRIQSQGGKHDVVNAICVDEANKSIYLAGSSTGYYGGGSLDSEHAVEHDENDRFSAFIMKLDINTMDIIWSRMIHTYEKGETSSLQDVLGLGCVVSSNRVFLTGTVKNNGNIDSDKSNGKDDIFAACWNKSGVRLWRKQVGTDQDDVLSRGHRSIALDENNNVMVVGSSRGVMYKTKKNPFQSDAFIITFSKDDGSITPFIKSTEANATSMPIIVIAGISFGCLIFSIGFFLLLMRIKKGRNQKAVITDAAANHDLSFSTQSFSTQSKESEYDENWLHHDEEKLKQII
jgi:hypothetical protein